MSYSQQARPFQKPAEHRTAYDKSFNKFYDERAQNAKTLPSSKHDLIDQDRS